MLIVCHNASCPQLIALLHYTSCQSSQTHMGLPECCSMGMHIVASMLPVHGLLQQVHVDCIACDNASLCMLSGGSIFTACLAV